MLRKAAYFLIGCLLIVIGVYVAHMVLGLLGLPGGIEQFAYVVVALLALVGIIYLAYTMFSGTPPP